MIRALSKTSAAFFVLTLSGCGGHTVDFTPKDGVDTPLGTTLDACPELAANVTLTSGNGDVVITKVCIRDELGDYYPPGFYDSPPPPPGLTVVPAGHTYAAVYVFAPGYTPLASAVSSSGTVYAAPDNIYGSTSGCLSLPEDDPSNLVGSNTTLDGSTLTQQLSEEIGSGEQVAVSLNVSAIFAGGPSCAAGGVCGGGFGLRFYVGGPPPGLTPDDPESGGPIVAGPVCDAGAD
jgi:hypothetical protein